MAVQAVVVTFNSAPHIAPCLDSLKANGAEPVVVDNGSSDTTLEILARDFPDVRVIRNPQNNYGGALNLGIRETSSEFVIGANADVVFHAGSVEALAEALRQNRRAGVAGPQQVFPDGTWQLSCGRIPGIGEGILDLLGWTTLHSSIRRGAWPRRVDRTTKNVGYVGGAVLALRRAAFDAIGGFDESFAFYAEETDLCLRFHCAGWQVLFHPAATVTHVRGGSSRAANRIPEKYLLLLSAAKTRLVRKHRGEVAARLYTWLEWLHSLKMYLVFRGFGLVRPAESGSRDRAEMFRLMARAWRNPAVLQP